MSDVFSSSFPLPTGPQWRSLVDGVLKGKDFDKFYVDNEVSYHKTVTNAVAAVLIPSAQNAELKSALEGAQPLFLKPLEHARMIQAGGSGMMSHGK